MAGIGCPTLVFRVVCSGGMRVVCGNLLTALMVEHNRVPDRKVADLSEKIADLERQLAERSTKEAALREQVGGCNLAAASEPRFGVWALCRASVWSALDAQTLVIRVCCSARPNDVVSSAERRRTSIVAEDAHRAAVEPECNAGKIRVHASSAPSPVFSPTCMNPTALARGMLVPADARVQPDCLGAARAL